MISIVNVSESWGIGKNGDLLIKIPEDMKFFRETTRGKVIIVGLNTLKSFPGCRPLKGRVNIVLAETREMIPEESIAASDLFLPEPERYAEALSLYGTGKTVLLLCTSLSEVLEAAGLFPPAEVFVCGGASVYRLLLPYCEEALITKNNCPDEPDTWYPDLDASGEWQCVDEGTAQICGDIVFRFTRYCRKQAEK